MKKITILLFCLSTITITRGQEKAITETGKEVILFDDRTWKYENEEVEKENEIPTNYKIFDRDEKSTFLLKSKVLNVGFWINPKIWSFKKSTGNEDAEYELKMKDGDLYGMIITEKIEIPFETLRSIAIENARKVAYDSKVVKEEYRTVNGLKILLLQMNGTLQGVKFSYYGYYFSSKNGTVQFITYTSQNLLEKYKSECEQLLNGFVEIN